MREVRGGGGLAERADLVKTMAHIQEDIAMLSTVPNAPETLSVSRERLERLRDIERLALLFRDDLLDAAGLRRALDRLTGKGGENDATP